MSAASPPRPRPPAPTTRSTLNDVSDDDSDCEDEAKQERRDSAGAHHHSDDAPAPPPHDDDPAPESWEEFWHNSTTRNARRAKEAGGDPATLASAKALPKGRHGGTLSRGVPCVPGTGAQSIHCFGCDTVTTNQLECAQCLEIFKRRSEKVAFDTFERAFFCSHLCYQGCYHKHKSRHGATRSAPTELDGREHDFEPAEGDGALWDAKALKRHTVEGCPAEF